MILTQDYWRGEFYKAIRDFENIYSLVVTTSELANKNIEEVVSSLGEEELTALRNAAEEYSYARKMAENAGIDVSRYSESPAGKKLMELIGNSEEKEITG